MLFKTGFTSMVVALVFMMLLSSAPATAMSDMSMLFSPAIGKLKFSADLEGSYAPDRQVEDQDGVEMGYSHHSLAFLAPIWQNSANEAALTIKGAVRNFDTKALLPDSGRSFPDDLKQVDIGGVYRHRAASGWIYGGGLSIGSSSDKLFNSGDETSPGAMAFVRIPYGEDQAWLFSVIYSPDNPYFDSVPLPGAAWMYTPSKRMTLMLGLPVMSLRYQPVDSLNLALTYVLPRTVNARAGWRLSDSLELFVRYAMAHESWRLADRPNEDNRLFYYENTAMIGFDYEVNPNVKLEIAAGQAFDRMYFEGENYDDRHQERINLEDGSVFSVKLNFGF